MLFWYISYFYKRISWLSFDVVLGAVLWHLVASKLPGNQGVSSWQATCVLALTTWTIYVIDRQIDNHILPPDTQRHKFQRQHQALLRKMSFGALALAMILCFWLPASVLQLGVVLALVIALYLFGILKTAPQSWYEMLKDIFVPIGYATGVWATAAVLQPSIAPETLWLGVAFWLIAQQNLLLNAYFESFVIDEGNSLAIVLGETTVKVILLILSLLVVSICIYVAIISPQHYAIRASIWLGLMALVQQYFCMSYRYFLPNDRYRYLSDGLFWVVPLLII